jgi:hypothetical protein
MNTALHSYLFYNFIFLCLPSNVVCFCIFDAQVGMWCFHRWRSTDIEGSFQIFHQQQQ